MRNGGSLLAPPHRLGPPHPALYPPQVSKEFETACPGLKVCSVYGGVSIGAQIRDLERGMDVVVGTPGRVEDLIDRGALNLTRVRGGGGRG